MHVEVVCFNKLSEFYEGDLNLESWKIEKHLFVDNRDKVGILFNPRLYVF